MTHPILFSFLVYLAILLGIGFWAARLTHNLSDYVLGGRRLGSTVTAVSAGASDMSGWLLLGLPGALYASGLSQVWIAVGLALGAYLNWRLVAPRLRTATEQAGDALTLPDFLGNRFQDYGRTLRLVSALVILIFFTFYTSSGLVSGALLFENSFHLDYHSALWIGAGVIVTYTFFGGFLAVSWSDLLQGILMLLALIVVPLVAVYELGGGCEVQMRLSELEAGFLDPFHGLSTLGLISLLAWGLGYFGQPHILARFMAVRAIDALPAARRTGMAWMILSLLGAMLTGVVGAAYFAKPLADSETVFLELVQILFNPWVAGLLLAAILSAIMSTIDSQLLVASSVITEDLYKALWRPQASQAELIWIGRGAVLVIAVFALFIAHTPGSSILDLVAYAWAGFGGAFGPVILFSLWWPRMTGLSGLTAIVCGAATVVVWKQLSTAGVIPFALYEIVPAFIVGSAVLVGVSLLWPATKIKGEIN